MEFPGGGGGGGGGEACSLRRLRNCMFSRDKYNSRDRRTISYNKYFERQYSIRSRDKYKGG